MKIAYSFMVIFLCMSIHASNRAEDRIVDAIRRSDPDCLHQLLMPGFYIRAEEKKRYLTLAKEITNETYAGLYSYSLSDAFRFLKGSAKFSGGVLSLYTGYLYYKKLWDIAQFEEHPDDNEPHIIEQRLDGREKRTGMYAFFGLLSGYLMYKGLGEFAAIFGKQQRFIKHRDALAVEAIVQRLQIFDGESN